MRVVAAKSEQDTADHNTSAAQIREMEAAAESDGAFGVLLKTVQYFKGLLEPAKIVEIRRRLGFTRGWCGCPTFGLFLKG